MRSDNIAIDVASIVCILIVISLTLSFVSCARSGFEWLPPEEECIVEPITGLIPEDEEADPDNGVEPDSDSDGWSDSEESSCGTDWLVSDEVCEGTEIKMNSSATKAQNYFGGGVSISGNRIIVGAPGEDGGEVAQLSDSGTATIFQMKDRRCVEKQVLTTSDAQRNDSLGWSLSLDGEVAIVGAHREDGGDGDSITDAGAAYIFGLDAGKWVERQKLTASDAQRHDWFGWSVSVSQTVAIVGAARADGDSEVNVGAAYIFRRVNGTWVERQRLMASRVQTENQFGYSVSISGNRAIIGAHREDGAIGDPDEPLDGPGAAYVFALENGQWIEKQRLIAKDAQVSDHFGNSVSMSGNVAIVGAYREDGVTGDPDEPLDGPGAAYIFALENEQWIEKH